MQLPKRKREIPHHHKCTVGGELIGCADPNCTEDYDTVCGEDSHKLIASNATVHRMAIRGVLPCCGLPIEFTPVGDRMTHDQKEWTCKGAPAGIGEAPTAEQIASAAVHDPFGG